MKVRYDNETGRLGKAYADSMVIPSPFLTLTTEEVNNIANQTDKIAFVVNGEVILRNKSEVEAEEQALIEAERIAKLHMTKLDFFKYVCQPNNITYANLMTFIGANDDLKAAWELCNHVYRGNTELNNYILQVIPALTESSLTTIFEEHNEI